MVSIASCVRLQSLSSSTACAVKVSASCMANGMKSESGLKRNSFNVLRVSSAAHSMVSPMRTHCGASGVSGCRKISVCVFCTSFMASFKNTAPKTPGRYTVFSASCASRKSATPAGVGLVKNSMRGVPSFGSVKPSFKNVRIMVRSADLAASLTAARRRLPAAERHANAFL